MKPQIKLHTKQLFSNIPLTASIQLFEDELNVFLSDGWILQGSVIQITNQNGKIVLIQQLYRLTAT
jgi:hypothetical protein